MRNQLLHAYVCDCADFEAPERVKEGGREGGIDGCDEAGAAKGEKGRRFDCLPVVWLRLCDI